MSYSCKAKFLSVLLCAALLMTAFSPLAMPSSASEAVSGVDRNGLSYISDGDSVTVTGYTPNTETTPFYGIESDGRYYGISTDAKTWEKAQADCEANGGSLVSIDDASEQAAVEELLTYAEQDEYWIGAQKIDGAWQSASGDSLQYTNWLSDQITVDDIDMMVYENIGSKSNTSVTVLEDGGWLIEATDTGLLGLVGPGTYDPSVYGYTHMAVTSDVPFRVSFYDNANAKWIATDKDLYSSFHIESGSYIPAGSYVVSMPTSSAYSTLPATAQISSIYIEFESAGRLVMNHFALSAKKSCTQTVPTLPSGTVVTTTATAAPIGETVTFTVGSVTGSVGDIVEVPVTVSDNHYIVNGQICIEYDASLLELQQINADDDNPYLKTLNEEIIKNSYMWLFEGDTPGYTRFMFAASAKSGSAAAGTVYSLCFKILSDEQASIPLDLSIPEMNSNDGANNDGEDYDTTLLMVDGAVTVSSSSSGGLTTQATTPTAAVQGADTVTFTVGSVSSLTGDFVQVPFSVSDNHFLVNGQLVINYDPSMLELQAITEDAGNPYLDTVNSSIFPSNYMCAVELDQPGTARFVFTGSSDQGSAVGGTMFYLTFKILGALGTSSTVSVAVSELASNDGATNNGEDYTASIVTFNGTIQSAVVSPDEHSVTMSVSSVSAAKGETVEVDFIISANSHMVNADFIVNYNSNVLRLVSDAYDGEYCVPNMDILGSNAFAAFNEVSTGEFVLSFATAASTGVTMGGTVFSLTFEILSDNTVATDVALTVDPLQVNTGESDYSYSLDTIYGTVKIEGAYDGSNLLQERFLVEGNEYVVINSDGSWSITGPIALAPYYSFSYEEYQYIVQNLTTDVPVSIGILDRDPNGVYADNWINLYSNWVGTDYFPVGTYDAVNNLKSVYDWNIKYSGWGNVGYATVRAVYITPDGTGTVTLNSLYLSKSSTGEATYSLSRTVNASEDSVAVGYAASSVSVAQSFAFIYNTADESKYFWDEAAAGERYYICEWDTKPSTDIFMICGTQVGIPATIGGLPVTTIAEGAFADASYMTSIAIPASVVSIENNAFTGCSALETVYYAGSYSDWSAITLGTGNEALETASINYRHTHTEEAVVDTAAGMAYTVCSVCATITETNGFVTVEDTLYYAQGGTFADGWVTIDGASYYFDPTTYAAVTNGCHLIDNFYYTFDESGVLLQGQLVRVIVNEEIKVKYIFAGEYSTSAFETVDGVTYWFDANGYMAVGTQILNVPNNTPAIYEIGADGAVVGVLDHTGSYVIDGVTYGVENGYLVSAGLHTLADGVYFCNNENGILSVGKTYVDTAYATAAYPVGWYYFDESGKMYDNEFVVIDGARYYMQNGTIVTGGVIEVDGSIYYAGSTGELKTGKVYVSATNGLLDEAGYYFFDESGALCTDGIVASGDDRYLIVDSHISTQLGVVEYNGAMYYVRDGGVLGIGKLYITANGSNGLVDEGYYYTDETGRFYNNEFAEIDGVSYYMVNGQPTAATGVTLIDGEYYAVAWNGEVQCGKIYVTAAGSNGLVDEGYYYTDASGRFYNNEFAEIDGKTYYMVNGRPQQTVGIFAVGENLYCADWDGAIKTGKLYVTEVGTNGYTTQGYIYTDESGRLYNGEFYEIDGSIFYMENGKPKALSGVVEIDGSLYATDWNGAIRIGKVYVTEAGTHGLTNEGYLYTDEHGRIYDEEFVTIDGNIYYMMKGQPCTDRGVVEIDGAYYYIGWDAVICTGNLYVMTTNDLTAVGWHYTDETGRFYDQEIVTIDGVVYYLEKGRIGGATGVTEIGGSYYYVAWNGIVQTGKVYVTAAGSNGVLTEGYYYADETGRFYNDEFAEIDGVLYFFQNGTIVKAGVFEFDGNLYYSNNWTGEIARSTTLYVTVNASNQLIIWGFHDFDENGIMIT